MNTKEDSLKILNDKRAELTKDRAEIQKNQSLLSRKIMNDYLSLEDVAKLYFPTNTAKSTNMNESEYRKKENFKNKNRRYQKSM